MTHGNGRSIYVDLDGEPHDLSKLTQVERELLDDLVGFAAEHPDAWSCEYANYFVRRVGNFYESLGLARSEIIKTTIWRVAQDISGRMMVEAGLARVSSDYPDELNTVIQKKFGSRREFCKATGISEDILSHALSKRKNLAIDTLSEALAKIGYTINIVPMTDASQPL